jgi:hypothetical protein
MKRVLQTMTGTTMGAGSEFRSPKVLQPLLGNHPMWPDFLHLLVNGASVPFGAREENSRDSREQENEDVLEYGNHKSANEHFEEVKRALMKDTLHGFSLPLTDECARRLPEAMVAPLGITAQMTIDHLGNRIPKYRMTHDQSFSTADGRQSFNDLALTDGYPELVYGYCLPRLIHYILSLRSSHPNQVVLLCKMDWKSAYRRVVADYLVAQRSLTKFDGLLHMSLRLTFGGKPHPFLWCIVSEITTDLTNDLLQSTWTPADAVSPHFQASAPIEYLPDDIPFAKTAELACVPPAVPEGQYDCFIDDAIGACLDSPEHTQRFAAAPTTAVHLVGRPLSDTEPLPRDPLPSLEKLEAEGNPSETKMCLGWELDTRRLLIRLPVDKYMAWKTDIESAIQRKQISQCDLESLIGRLNHVAFVIPTARHFMNRIRKCLRPNGKPWYRIKLPQTVRADLLLWLDFLEQAHLGISMNNIASRMPDRILLTDACPAGMGGYSISSGTAWRFTVPPEYSTVLSNNLLEFLASTIGIRLELPVAATPVDLGPCILALGDNSSGIGWLHKSNFDQENQAGHETVARSLSRNLMQSHSVVFPVHIPGKKNIVADFLSRHSSWTDQDLSNHCHTHFHSQIPQTFEVKPLPNELVSWIWQMLQLATSSSTASKRALSRNTTAHGHAGVNSSSASAWSTTCSSTASVLPAANSSLSDSSKPCEMPNLQTTVRSLWETALSGTPSSNWLRPSGRTFAQAHATTTTTRAVTSPL